MTADINFFSYCGAIFEWICLDLDMLTNYPRVVHWRERAKARSAVVQALKSEDRTAPGLRTWSGGR